ncbi:MAG: hypothetical protein EHM71_17945, partial [Zetaproteobacteria bacterium]
LIELGSNAARLLLADVVMGNGYRVMCHKRVQTRLASGPEGRLSGQAIRDTLAAVRRFLRSLPAGNGMTSLAVATAAVRDAENRAELLSPLIHKYGLNVVVLSPHDEACLGALAALHNLPVRDGVIFDLGGGSLQLARIRDGQVDETASVPIGAVRMTDRFLRDDPPSQGELAALRAEIAARMSQAIPAPPGDGSLVGLGGTVRALASLRLATRADEATRHGLVLHQSEIAAIRARLAGLPLRERQRVPGLRPERADIIVAGTVVVEELLRATGYSALTVSTFGVRDGFLIRRTFPGTWPLRIRPVRKADAMAPAQSAA